jgi:ABC-type lipoprotein release transport system permease subunit
MTFFALLVRNLRYHWRGNLAVFLGVGLGAAVLTGALFVGDSLRGSLKEMSLDRLGWVAQAMTPGRFFRAELAEAIDPGRALSVLLLQAAATRSQPAGQPRSVGKVNLLGIDENFWDPTGQSGRVEPLWREDESAVALNRTLANELGVAVGDKISLNVQKADAVPRESLLGKRDDVVQSITATVKKVLPDYGMALFSLRPSPEPVRNAFVWIKFLQKELELPNKANAMLIGSTQANLEEKLAASLTLDDWNLRLRTPADRARSLIRFLEPRNQGGVLKKKLWEGRVPEAIARSADQDGNLSAATIVDFYQKSRPWSIVESEQLFLDSMTERPAETAANGNSTIRVLVYLADSIAHGGVEMPYAVIGAKQMMLPSIHDNKPIDDLVMPLPRGLKDDEIALVDWPGMPLPAKIGDSVTVTYYVPDERNQLMKKSEAFRLAMLMPMEVGGENTDDPDWTPEFPGITDKLSISQWKDPPFPYDPKRVKPIDEHYWKRYRATPKAYVTLATAQRLWASRFGKLTSIRVPAGLKNFDEKVIAQLDPPSGGFVIQNVRQHALQSSSGSSDFGVLFLAFSFFLIASALLLVGLLFRLNLDRRAAEMGLLLATGWSHRQVRWLLLAEGLILAVVGAAAGLFGALLYGSAMLQMLAASWPGGSRLAFLRLHAEPKSYAIGYGASLAVCAFTLVWATRVFGKMAPSALLAGETTTSIAASARPRPRLGNAIIIASGLIAAAASLSAGIVMTSHEAKAGSFFGAGALLLTAALALMWRWLRSSGGAGEPQPSLTRLGVRNAGRHPARSVLTAGLLASATFLIVAVEAFHKETGLEFSDKPGGSGGFAFIAETDVPVFRDLSDPKTQLQWNVTKEQMAMLRKARFYGLRLRHGDDASCLNLYQPLKPRMLGVPAALAHDARFAFSATIKASASEAANPWLLLEREFDDGAIPAILDANTAQWILKIGLGESLETIDEQGNNAKLRVVALLRESIFQSEMLIAERSFLRLFPRQEGFQYFLVETAPDQAEAVRDALAAALAEQGVNVVSTVQRLQSYLAVENMYLDTFKALGGLGLLLGAAGLAIVLLRGVWERRGELALLRALGFGGGQLAWLVLAENIALLVLGVGAGAASALLAVAPHLAGSGATPLWGRLALLLASVVAVGLASGAVAVWGSLRTPVLTALRRE